MIDRLLAAGSDLLLAGPLFFRFLSRSVQYSFWRILLLLLLKFHNGIYVTGSAPERAPMCGLQWAVGYGGRSMAADASCAC